MRETDSGTSLMPVVDGVLDRAEHLPDIGDPNTNTADHDNWMQVYWELTRP